MSSTIPNQNTIISKVEFINDHFKIPIAFVKNSELSESIANDLELVKSMDPSNCDPVYHFAFQPKTKCGKKVLEQVARYYTTDVDFLSENQELLKKYANQDVSNQDVSNQNVPTNSSLETMIELWDEVKNDTGFKEKYYYLDWSYLEHLNKSEGFLQMMSMYSMSAPVISLFIPIIILIVPFFIIKAKGLHVTMGEYVDVLKIIASNHAIGKLFTQFHEVSVEQKVYLVLSAAFYIFSIYQNCLTCIRFHKNMNKIYTSLINVRHYVNDTLTNMQTFLSNTEKMKTFAGFNENMRRHISVLEKYKAQLDKISGDKMSFVNIKEIGSLLKYFYELYQDAECNESFMYSFGFNGYLDNLCGLAQNIKENKMAFATFTPLNILHLHRCNASLPKSSKKGKEKEKGKEKGKEKEKEKGKEKEKEKEKDKDNDSHSRCVNGFTKAYYGPLINKKHVKNDLNLDKNITITGPNASGKTTVLKTTLINILLSQQSGCGFYESGNFVPYKHIHCYLNIPDTSGRDSLFQAEARRCKEIIDSIHANNQDTHFCVFDELYSGTNPDEAVTSALRFMEYLVKFPNVKCLLTTHFISVCKSLDKQKMVKNYHMKTVKKINKDNNNDNNDNNDNDNNNNNTNEFDFDFEYTYLLKKGISEVRGGMKVLKDMNYPDEILR